MKYINFLLIFILVFTQFGCAQKSIFSQAEATTKGSRSEYKKVEPSEGYNNLLSGLGMAILFGTIFQAAPKEAYK